MRGYMGGSDTPGGFRSDWQAGYYPVSENLLQKSGLRAKHLYILIAIVVVLWIIAILTFVFNILMLAALRINTKGMESLQFVRVNNPESGEMDHIVQFSGKNIRLGTVVTNSGVIGGYANASMMIDAARVLFETNTSREGLGGFQRWQSAWLILEDRRIRAEGVENFLVTDLNTGRPLFSANRPRFQLSRKTIKKIAAEQIITNKVRSPVDKPLKFEVENLSFRGNEGNKFKAKTFRMTAQNMLNLRTSENGAIRLEASEGIFLNAASRLPISTSPSLRANVLGYRICCCVRSGRLFAVPGNKMCATSDDTCL